MGSIIRRAAACAALLVTFTFAAVPAPAIAAMEGKFKVGDAAPDFTLSDLGGRPMKLSSFAGSKVVLLAFWSLRCGACIQEMPFIEKLHKDYQGKGLAVISVVTDGVDATTTAAIMKDVGAAPSYPVLVDPDFAVSDTYTNFVVPYTLVIDRKGVIRYEHTGFEKGTEKQYEAAITAALGS